jgi:hypothetical protein
MAEHRIRSGRQNRSQPPSLLRQTAVADGIDAAMKRAQGSASEAALDAGVAKAEITQLSRRDHAVLARRQLSDWIVHATRAAFPAHRPVNAARVRIRPTGCRQMRLQSAGTASGFDPLK